MHSTELNVKPITITVPNALAMSGLGRTKLYEMIARGAIRTIRVGRRRLVVYASLEALLQGGDV